MIRWLATVMLLATSAAPAFACDWHQSVSTDGQQKTVASQPSNDQGTPPTTAPAERAPS